MPTGVPQEAAYHAVLEDQLNRRYPEKHIEILNFGVEMYGLREVLGTVRHRVFDWDPDLLIVAITSYTAYLKWEEPGSGQSLPETRNPLYESWFLRAVDSRLGTGWYESSLVERPTVGKDMALYDQQVIRAFRELDDISTTRRLPVLVMWLSFGQPGPELEPALRALSEELAIDYLPVWKRLEGEGEILVGRQLSRQDSHPNAATHAIIADELMAEFINKKYLTVHNES
jgi:hypothetical protein